MFFSISLGAVWDALISVIGFLLVIVLLRSLIRRVWLADMLGAVFFGARGFGAANGALAQAVSIAMGAFAFYSLVWSLRRFGFLAPLALVAVVDVVLNLPFSASSWYAGRALVAWTIPVAAAAWALWAILSAQRKPAADSAN
jgi:hypothetical protein